jgi:hypothetical protein
MTTSLLIPTVLNALALIACGLSIWVGQDNHKAAKIPSTGARPFDAELTAFNKNGFFRLLDRIPLLRRSGQGTVNDLTKGMIITLIISFLPTALLTPLVIDLWASAFLLSLSAAIIFMHPALSHRQHFADNLRGRSPFKRNNS